MKLNVFQKVSGLVLAGVIGSVAHAQSAANVPDGTSGTYTSTSRASSPMAHRSRPARMVICTNASTAASTPRSRTVMSM